MLPLKTMCAVSLQYNTIRQEMIFTCAQKPTKRQLNLAHGTETKNKEKQKTCRNRVAKKKRSGQQSMKAVQKAKVKLRDELGFVIQLGFKPGVKERGSYG